MNIKKLFEFDRGNVLKTYEDTQKQFIQIFEEFDRLNFGNRFSDINKILVCAMGGSALGPDLVKSVFSKNIKIPIIISNEYSLPNWVDKNTLVVVISFSGTTEESIRCFNEAKKLGLKTFVICSGGDLAKSDSFKFVYEAKYNYAKNPRFAVGYSIAGFLSLLLKLDLLNFDIKKIKSGVSYFYESINDAEKIAKKIYKKSSIIIASEHLFGNAHTFQNQINETGKNFSCHFSIPEICHHQFEGLSYPENLDKNFVYILCNSRLYFKRNQKRYEIMKNILNKKKISFVEISPLGKNVWEESMNLLGVSSYVAFYLAYINGIDPQPNPWVDYLKKEIKK